MNRALKLRLSIFATVSAVAVSYTAVTYAQLDERVVDTSHEVDVHLARSGGIFTGAEVTFRGVPVGKVARVDLAPDGVVASLRIDDEWDVPKASIASVHNRSAVGEQYVDLVPITSSGPFLTDGDEIPRERTTVPVEEEELLKSTRDLAQSVPLDDLRTVVFELGTAFSGSGEDLQQILDGSDQYLTEATEHLPQTIDLLRSSEVTLSTFNESESSLVNFSRDLASFSGAIRASDADLRKTIADSAGFARENRLLLAEVGEDLPELLTNVTTLNLIGATHLPHLEEFFWALQLSLRGTAAARYDRGIFVSASSTMPAVCKQGYIPSSQWRSPHDFTYVTPDYSVRCAEGLPALPRGTETRVGPTKKQHVR